MACRQGGNTRSFHNNGAAKRLSTSKASSTAPPINAVILLVSGCACQREPRAAGRLPARCVSRPSKVGSWLAAIRNRSSRCRKTQQRWFADEIDQSSQSQRADQQQHKACLDRDDGDHRHSTPARHTACPATGFGHDQRYKRDRPDRNVMAGAEYRVKQRRCHCGEKAHLGRQSGKLGVSHRLRHQQDGQYQPGDPILQQTAAAIGLEPSEPWN